MEETFHYLLLWNQGAFQRMVMQRLEASGLTLGQPKILDYLLTHDGCMQKELAIACQVDAATVVGLINRMETAGLLERRQQVGNRRSFYVHLTENGRQKAQEVQQAFEQLERQAFAGFSAEEHTALVQGMKTIQKNLMETGHENA